MRSSAFQNIILLLQCLTALTVGLNDFRDWYQHMDAPDALRVDGQAPLVAIPSDLAKELIDPLLYDRSVPRALDTLRPFVLKARTSRSFKFVLDTRSPPQAPPLLDVSMESFASDLGHELQIHITVKASNPRCPAPLLQTWRTSPRHMGTEIIDIPSLAPYPAQTIYRFRAHVVGGRWTSDRNEKMVLRIPRHPRLCTYEIREYEIHETWSEERLVPRRYRALHEKTSYLPRKDQN